MPAWAREPALEMRAFIREARADRQQAVEDRKQAAEDRRQAARDRRQFLVVVREITRVGRSIVTGLLLHIRKTLRISPMAPPAATSRRPPLA